MSIADEITRLQTAKADIKDSIEAKGVTVPSDASIDTYYDYIDQIETGGGGTNYLEQYANKSLSGAITSAQLGTNIGSNMPQFLLYGQSGITSVDLTNTGAESVSAQFCSGCNNLTNITLANTITTIGDNFGYSAGENTTSGITITIPSSVTTIQSNFLAYSKVNSITIPSTVTSFDSYSFNYGTINTIIYNASTGTVPGFTCQGVSGLSLVDLNSSISSINSGCFSANQDDANLLEIVLRKSDNIVTLSEPLAYDSSWYIFGYRQHIKVYVPSALIANYQADNNWAAGVTANRVTFVALEGSQYE